jgi:uncharacterized protein (DUF1697 family)
MSCSQEARFCIEGKAEAEMPVIIAMLRGVNLGPHRRIKMADLCAVCESLRFRDIQTYVQSGNVIFRTDERDLSIVTKRMEKAIEKRFGFQSDTILRTATEMRAVVAKNPFAKRRGIDPKRLLVTFLAADPGEEARDLVRKMKTDPEELRIDGRELFIYYPNGMARPKISWPALEKILRTSGTGRNWNSVTNMLQIAEKLKAEA